MRYKGLILSAFVVSMFLAAAMVPLFEGGNGMNDLPGSALGADGTDFTGYTAITTAAELSDIRSGLNGKYYLANDIDFSTDTSYDNGGVMIPLEIKVESGKLSVTVGTISDLISNSIVRFGTLTSNLTAGVATELVVSNDVKETLMIGGMIDSKPFAFSVKVDTSDMGTKYTSFDSNGNFDPIGTSSTSFTGKFDGNGYKISGMNVTAYSSSSEAYSGMFGYVGYEGEIKNLGLVNGSSTAVTTSSSAHAYAGSIVGYYLHTYSGGTKITNCYNTGSVSATAASASAYAGGIIGNSTINVTSFGQNNTTITGSYNTGPVTAASASVAYAGGMIGYSAASSSNGHNNTTITGSYNTGSVSATATSAACAGGMIGYSVTSGSSCNNDTKITNCYNTGSVSATAASPVYAGGMIGYSTYSGSNLTAITNCYNIGPISVPAAGSCGGIIGFLSTSGTVINCYYLTNMLSKGGVLATDSLGTNPSVDDGTETPERKTGAGTDPDQNSSTAKSAGDMTPSLLNAMNNDSIYFTGTTGSTAGWDFINTWIIVDGTNDGYPVLAAFQPTVTVSGTVTGPSGPLSGAEITYTGGSATTASDGTYSFTVASGQIVTISSVTLSGYEIDPSTPVPNNLGAVTSDRSNVDFSMSSTPSPSPPPGGDDDPGMSLTMIIAIVAVIAVIGGAAAFWFIRK